LESIVGRDFLPRGNNIVTRRPIQITLVNTPSASKDWGEFMHKPGEKFYDFTKIRDEIDRDTEKVCGPNKDISSVKIVLKLFSARFVDLTLIDLPGITKVPTGDQPSDIEHKILDLCYQYVYPKSAIIMAVCPANQDLANADALKLARKVDHTGDRTIGVLTKVDLMDEGTSVNSILQGKIYPLKLGYVPIVCRSQKNI
jgi:replication fork clamp-binding protein CrfC